MSDTPRTDKWINKEADGEREINQRLTDELKEARAEIERLNGILDGAIDNKKTQDALIKQMLEAAQKIENIGLKFNDGCGCCMSEELEQSEEFKNLISVISLAKG